MIRHAPIIRRAETTDASTLTSIALEAKQHWGYPTAWIAGWAPALTVTAAFIARHDVFAAVVNGQIVAFYALVEESGRWELDHLWVRPRYMGHGVGRQLFEHAMQRLNELAPNATLFIEADPNAEAFYVRMGAQRIGQITRDWQGLLRVLSEFALSPRQTHTS